MFGGEDERLESEVHSSAVVGMAAAEILKSRFVQWVVDSGLMLSHSIEAQDGVLMPRQKREIEMNLREMKLN